MPQESYYVKSFGGDCMGNISGYAVYEQAVRLSTSTGISTSPDRSISQRNKRIRKHAS